MGGRVGLWGTNLTDAGVCLCMGPGASPYESFPAAEEELSDLSICLRAAFRGPMFSPLTAGTKTGGE